MFKKQVNHQQIWQRTLRKYRRVQSKLQGVTSESLRLQLNRKLQQLSKRLLRLNRRWQLGIASSVLVAWMTFQTDQANAQVLELSSLDGSDGFTINGIDADNRSGFSISGVGDVNGDGYEDILIGAYRAAPNGKSDAGENYLVFGSSSGFGTSLELSSLDGNNGFVINGIDANDRSGRSVSGQGM